MIRFTCATVLMLFIISASPGAPDARNITTGYSIPGQGYCDQPYVVITRNGDWLCTLTTGAGHEGQGGQHVISTICTDQGRTWSPLVDIEPSTGPAASWAVPLVTPSGRVYVFYTYNGDNVHLGRDDTHGWYAMKYSDDNGASWSRQRYRLPVRRTACDNLLKDGKLVQMFWGIDKPKVANGTAYFAFTKLGRYFLEAGEGWLFASDNLLTVTDPRGHPLANAAKRRTRNSQVRLWHNSGRAQHGAVEWQSVVLRLSDDHGICLSKLQRGWRTDVDQARADDIRAWRPRRAYASRLPQAVAMPKRKVLVLVSPSRWAQLCRAVPAAGRAELQRS